MPKIEVSPKFCKGCKLCLAACPKHLLIIGDKFNSFGDKFPEQIDAEKCIGCKLCAIMCPEAAITVYKD